MISQSKLAQWQGDLEILELGCGTGVLTNRLLQGDSVAQATRDRMSITTTDAAESMVKFVQERKAQNNWSSVKVAIVDGMDTKLPDSHYSHVFFHFGPFVLPQPREGLKEMYRILQPDGVVGFTIWVRNPWLDEFRPAIEADPTLPPYPSQKDVLYHDSPESWEFESDVREKAETAGFVDVSVKVLEHDVKTTTSDARSKADGAIGAVAERFWTPEQRNQFMKPAIDAVGKCLVDKYGENGHMNWRWRAYVATGRKPSV
jgi:SAM-dependent methyltransferase